MSNLNMEYLKSGLIGGIASILLFLLSYSIISSSIVGLVVYSLLSGVVAGIALIKLTDLENPTNQCANSGIISGVVFFIFGTWFMIKMVPIIPFLLGPGIVGLLFGLIPTIGAGIIGGSISGKFFYKKLPSL